MYVEICLDSGTLRFTGSGSSMRKAKQAAASLALHEVGFKQGGIKCGNRGTGFLDSEGSHR